MNSSTIYGYCNLKINQYKEYAEAIEAATDVAEADDK